MKKIFTLVLGLMLTVAIFAADHRPTVTVSASRKYEIVIDGKRHLSNFGSIISISNMFNGLHEIRVYEMRQGFFMNSKKLMASSVFKLRNNDLQINVDRFGQLQIRESRFKRDWNDHGYSKDDNDWNHRNERDHDKHF